MSPLNESNSCFGVRSFGRDGSLDDFDRDERLSPRAAAVHERVRREVLSARGTATGETSMSASFKVKGHGNCNFPQRKRESQKSSSLKGMGDSGIHTTVHWHSKSELANSRSWHVFLAKI